MRSSIRATLFLGIAAGNLFASAALADDMRAALAAPMPTYESQWPSPEKTWDAGAVIVGRNVMHSEALRGSWQPDGVEGRVGSPYYYSAPINDGSCCGDGSHYRSYLGASEYAAPYDNGPYYLNYGGNYGTYGQLDHYLDAAHEFKNEHLHELATMIGGTPVVLSNPYTYYPGHRYFTFSDIGHIRFPYYSYRFPWYFPGHPILSRNTNLAW